MLTFIKRLTAALGLLAVVMAVYLFVARPYQLNWGATEQEISAPMPGDELDPAPDFFATRAITITAYSGDVDRVFRVMPIT